MLSIITPNLNNGEYLEANIISIQGLLIPFEHIVVDGGSTDNSLEILSKYPHVKVLHQTEKTGMYGALHQGILSSQGQIVTWVNSDDKIIPEGYRVMYKKIIEKNTDFVYSDGIYHDIRTQKMTLGKGRFFGKFFLKNGCIPAMQPSILFSKHIYTKVGGFNYTNFKICGDLDLFVKIANRSELPFHYIRTSSSIFTKRGNSLGDLNTDTYHKEITNNKLPMPNFLIRILFYICKYI